MLNNSISFINQYNDSILNKIKNNGNFYFSEYEIGQEIVVAPDDCFIIKDITNFTEEEKKFIKPFFTSINRYYYYWKSKFIIYLNSKNFDAKNIGHYKNVYIHFKKYKKLLEQSKIKYKTPNKAYFYLHRERDENMFKEGYEKIVSVGRTDHPKFCYILKEFYGSRALFFIQTSRINLKYATGILNSKIIYFWLYNKGKKQGEQLQVDKGPLLEIPIHKTDDKTKHDKLVTLVDKMLELNRKIQTINSPHEKEIIERQIEAFDREIDKIVYGLYGLSEEEIKVVEGE